MEKPSCLLGKVSGKEAFVERGTHIPEVTPHLHYIRKPTKPMPQHAHVEVRSQLERLEELVPPSPYGFWGCTHHQTYKASPLSQ